MSDLNILYAARCGVSELGCLMQQTLSVTLQVPASVCSHSCFFYDFVTQHHYLLPIRNLFIRYSAESYGRSLSAHNASRSRDQGGLSKSHVRSTSSDSHGSRAGGQSMPRARRKSGPCARASGSANGLCRSQTSCTKLCSLFDRDWSLDSLG
jgi:hypothetical protein